MINETKLPYIAMNTYKAKLYIIVLNLICLCFSAQAWANHQFETAHRYSDDNIDSALLSRLYQHSTDYLWLENKKLKVQAHEALAFIAVSSQHGLNPDDYHYALLQQIDQAASDANAQRFDMLLTDGLLKLIRDITIGHLDPAVVDPKWTIPRMPFDAVEFLQHALQVDNFGECLNALIPASNQYHYLKAAAVRYQTFIDNGGWPEITETPMLRIGDNHRNIPAIRKRLAVEDDTIVSDMPSHYDDNMEQAVKRFQRRYSLKVDGIIGPATRNAMNVSAAERLQQIKINMERIRWLPDNLGERYIMVNLANYRLTAIDDNQTKLNMRVIVGKKKRPTPSFASKITRVVLNPHWYVPSKLARLDLLPKQQSNPDYFDQYNFRVFNDKNGKRTEVDPGSIDWQSMTKQNFPYSLVQEPGKNNALGRLKFIVPNPWSIYLHDTPAKSLFDQPDRNFSSGCIRVEDPIALAKFSLAGNNRHQELLDFISTNKSYSTKLEQPLSVYTVYSTVWCDGNELIFSPDSYKRDQKMTKYL